MYSLEIGLIAYMALTVAADARPRSEGTRQPSGPEVMVCLQNSDAVNLPVLELARRTAVRIFAMIDVQLKWCKGSDGPARTNTATIIAAQIDPHVPDDFHPGALAYALPYESAGTRIHVLVERMPHWGQDRPKGVFLGHVMAHEIAHVLEGVSCHSSSGVMKAKWNGGDIQRMLSERLSFSEEDVFLIHAGLEKSAAMSR